MRLLHVGLLLGCLLELVAGKTPPTPVVFGLALGAVGLAQALRYWAVISLGTAWNTRVIVVHGSEASRRGPYRWLRHPNYVAVVIEGIALPAACGAFATLVAFTILNAWLLSVRIRCEERMMHALARDYELVGSVR